MKQILFLVTIASLTVLVGGARPYSATGASYDSASILGGKTPAAYRNWTLVSVAHEEGNLNDIRAILGNDIAVTAYRRGQLPFPDGAIIARLAWSYVPSEENNKVFGRPQSFVAGLPTNVQFMVKDSPEILNDRGLGFQSIQRRQTGQYGPAKLLFMPCAGRSTRLYFHPLLTLAARYLRACRY